MAKREKIQWQRRKKKSRRKRTRLVEWSTTTCVIRDQVSVFRHYSSQKAYYDNFLVWGRTRLIPKFQGIPTVNSGWSSIKS